VAFLLRILSDLEKNTQERCCEERERKEKSTDALLAIDFLSRYY